MTTDAHNRVPLIRRRELLASHRTGESIDRPRVVFEVTAVNNDTLTCVMPGGLDEVAVYKPLALIQSLHPDNDAYTYTYTGTQERTSARKSDASDTEDQHVVPRHRVGELIEAQRAPVGLADQVGTAVKWIECDSGRAWALKNEEAE